MKTTNIAIIGTGAVGSTIAYACLLRNIASNIMLVDINKQSCHGQLLDLSDVLGFSSTATIEQVDYQTAAQADIIIIAAGKPQQKGQSRQELLHTNSQAFAAIAHDLTPLNPQAIIIIVTNPVDTLTMYAQKLFNIPKNQIFGSGTILDTQRLRNLIAQHIHINEASIHVNIIGQHGDLQVAALSSACIAGIPLTNFISEAQLKQYVTITTNKVYDIITCKGYTNYGVASCVVTMCEDIIFNQQHIMPISCFIPAYDLCMSLPAALGSAGVTHIIHPILNSHEQQQLELAIKALKSDLLLL